MHTHTHHTLCIKNDWSTSKNRKHVSVNDNHWSPLPLPLTSWGKSNWGFLFLLHWFLCTQLLQTIQCLQLKPRPGDDPVSSQIVKLQVHCVSNSAFFKNYNQKKRKKKKESVWVAEPCPINQKSQKAKFQEAMHWTFYNLTQGLNVYAPKCLQSKSEVLCIKAVNSCWRLCYKQELRVFHE